MPTDRIIPATGYAHDSRWWSRCLDSSERIAVFWPRAATESSPDTITLVGYYDTLSEAITAAAAERTDNGGVPEISINWSHPDVIKCAGTRHRAAQEDLPAWIDTTVPA